MAEEASSDESFDSDVSLSEEPSSPSTATTPPLSPSPGFNTPRQGYVELKEYTKKGLLGDKWRLSWCYVDGCHMYIYRSYEESEPMQSVDLRTVSFGEGAHTNRKFSVSFKTDDHHKWISCVTQHELAVWRAALDAAKSLPPSPSPPVRSITVNKRSNALFRIKKNVAGRAATSKMGEVLLMKMFGDDIHHLLLSVRKIVTKYYDKDVANRVHKVLIRLTIKIALLFEKKLLSVADISGVDRPLREGMELLSKYYNSRVRKFMNKAYPANETFARIDVLSKQCEEEMVRKLQPFISPKNVNNIHFLFQTVGSGEFLQKVWSATDSEFADELDELDDLITAYTQFHI